MRVHESLELRGTVVTDMGHATTSHRLITLLAPSIVTSWKRACDSFGSAILVTVDERTPFAPIEQQSAI